MSGLGVIIGWLRTFWGWVETGFTWILDGSFFYSSSWSLPSSTVALGALKLRLAAVDLSSVVFNYAATWSHLPTQLIWLINAVGLPQCFAILGSAYLHPFGS